MNKPTVGSWLVRLEGALRPWSETARLDAQVLLANIMKVKRSWVMAHAEAPLSAAQELALTHSLVQLQQGTPLPYVLGRWEFYGLEFDLTPQVLIPRPETELLVEQALRWLQAHPGEKRALDVGTGSGCIAVSLAVHAPQLHATAADISPQALDVARANAAKHGVLERVDFVISDLLASLDGEFDLLCANLPYIPTQTLQGLSVAAHEPRLALDGGQDGLDLVRRLLLQAPAMLAAPGLALLEIEAAQGSAALALGREAFPQARVEILRDLGGKDRLLRIERE